MSALQQSATTPSYECMSVRNADLWRKLTVAQARSRVGGPSLLVVRYDGQKVAKPDGSNWIPAEWEAVKANPDTHFIGPLGNTPLRIKKKDPKLVQGAMPAPQLQQYLARK